MHNNLKIELIQEQAHSLRGNCFGNKKNIPWPKKKKKKRNLENQTKNVSVRNIYFMKLWPFVFKISNFSLADCCISVIDITFAAADT